MKEKNIKILKIKDECPQYVQDTCYTELQDRINKGIRDCSCFTCDIEENEGIKRVCSHCPNHIVSYYPIEFKRIAKLQIVEAL